VFKQWRSVSLALLGASFVAAPLGAQTWSQVWSAEFDGTDPISSSNWTYDVGGGGWGNGELQYYQGGTANVSRENGYLTIQARRQNVGGMAYTSGRIKTQGKMSFGPGDAHPVKLQARIAGPNGQGLWPAFWMLGTNIDSVAWPGCGELDIMEHINSTSWAQGAIHWVGPNGGQKDWVTGHATVDFEAWHYYAITWDPDRIRWLLDGTPIGTYSIADNINSTEEFHRSFFVILNLAVGGAWPGPPNGSTEFPANLKVEFLRYFRG